MPTIDPAASIAIQPELVSGETLLWAGRPVQKLILHKQDLYLIPFSLLWGGFTFFWEGAVSGLLTHLKPGQSPWNFGTLWGIPFVVIGQYLMWGRFLYAAWKKRRTLYAVTDRRVITVQNGRTVSACIDQLPAIILERGWGAGTIRFPQQETWFNRQRDNSWDSMAVGTTPAFIDVEDAATLYRMIATLR